MLQKIFYKLFGSKQEREVAKYRPMVDRINAFSKDFESLDEESLQNKTQEFRDRLKNGETLDEILEEAFAVVKQACIRNIGKKWIVDGKEKAWDMIPYDVQIMGGIILSQGKIAEMATGEGKTLVALFPVYLHGLTGKGVHVITVNDYLAKRDCSWVGNILEYLGLSVGVITSDLKDHDYRKNEYAKDVTYGVNHEFGFDYLRDNMVVDIRMMVQRGFEFCLIDEVDSILIDDARMPLIISGPVENENEHRFLELKPDIEMLVKEQKKLVGEEVQKAEKIIFSEEEVGKDKIKDAYKSLLIAKKGLPKHKKLRKILTEKGVSAGVMSLENEHLRDKTLSSVTDILFYTIDEKSHIADINDRGHDFLTKSKADKNMFILPDLSLLINEIEKSDLSDKEKEEKKEILHGEYTTKSDKLHTIQQLLRAYSLYDKDVEYVVSEGKVIIVDQSTGRLKYDSRFSDGMHQAIEAKEGVNIGQSTQTVASITYQNYFRMYKKLAGMTGTAITEENEFMDIYKLPVSEVPTNRPIARDDQDDLIYKTKKDKYNAIIEEVENLIRDGRPVLLGTPDVDVSEIMHRLLKMRKIPHNLLNAKNHAMEAQIVAEAGVSKSVTIATNMAGRGTDIKLGDGVKEKGGLAIIGCERHNSRRIDRQLRGRAGRQGDPGSSVFYISLEDNLMRLFGSERIATVMDKLGHKDGEPIAHPWITRSIEKAQKRVEAYNFGARKNLLEYDEVMNKKRHVIYKRRKAALIKGAISEGIKLDFSNEYGIDPNAGMDIEVYDMIDAFTHEVVRRATSHTDIIEDWDIDYINEILRRTVLLSFDINDLEVKSVEDIEKFISNKIVAKYKDKRDLLGENIMILLDKIAILQSIDKNWQQHLRDDEELRNGIGLMAHAQKDPIVEYKKRSYENFKEMIFDTNQEALEFIFKARINIELDEKQRELQEKEEKLKKLQKQREGLVKSNFGKSTNSDQRVVKKIGRNDPCSCNSGKKYKNCCGKK